jgi:hypothetical protein
MVDLTLTSSLRFLDLIRGFGETWITWTRKLVVCGSVSVMANGEESHTFKTGKGLMQSDPLSPVLFNLVVDTLTRMMEEAGGAGLVTGLMQSFRPGGILTL